MTKLFAINPRTQERPKTRSEKTNSEMVAIRFFLPYFNIADNCGGGLINRRKRIAVKSSVISEKQTQNAIRD